MNSYQGYIGTYASPASRGIYSFSMDADTGKLSVPKLFFEAPDCKYLSLRRSLLAAPVQRPEGAGVMLLDLSGPQPKPAGICTEEQKTPCFAVQDDTRLYTANYHEGTVLIYQKQPDGLKLMKKLLIAPGAGCHQILFHGSLMMVPCLLLDEIRLFDMDRDFAPAGVVSFPKGTGPRHGIFDSSHRHLYLVSELSNELFIYRTEGPAGFRLLESKRILSEGKTYSQPPASAAVRLSPDGQFLYVSTRFAEVITVYRLTDGKAEFVQQADCGGIHPRDFLITPDGKFLLAANRTSGDLVSFRLDVSTGRLTDSVCTVPVPEAVAVVLDI